MKLDMASVPQWGHERHIVFKTINENVAKCHLFHENVARLFCRFCAISKNGLDRGQQINKLI